VIIVYFDGNCFLLWNWIQTPCIVEIESIPVGSWTWLTTYCLMLSRYNSINTKHTSWSGCLYEVVIQKSIEQFSCAEFCFGSNLASGIISFIWTCYCAYWCFFCCPYSLAIWHSWKFDRVCLDNFFHKYLYEKKIRRNELHKFL